MDTVHSAITEPVRRLEVFTGAGRRRKWRDEDKARIVAEIVTSGDAVRAVARRHGLSPQDLKLASERLNVDKYKRGRELAKLATNRIG
jgi:transposase-like protein